MTQSDQGQNKNQDPDTNPGEQNPGQPGSNPSQDPQRQDPDSPDRNPDGSKQGDQRR